MPITRRHFISTLLAGAVAFTTPTTLYAAQDPIYTGFLSSLAIRGYDAVAYFKDGKAVEGSSEFQLEWMGAQWRFSSWENLEAFQNSPLSYAPQYGGYCAWAVAHGDTASIDPKAWKIVGGKLYLNYSKDIQRRWERDIPGYIKSADANWPEVLN